MKSPKFSTIELALLQQAVKAYQAELQAEIDFRLYLLAKPSNEYEEEHDKIRKEILEKREEQDKAFALKLKLHSISR